MSILSRSLSSRTPAFLRMRRSSVMSSFVSTMRRAREPPFRLNQRLVLAARAPTVTRFGGTANLGDPPPTSPAALDGVVQGPSAWAERGVDDQEQEEHEGVDDPRPDVRRTGAVRTPEPLGHGPDDEAQENPTRVC